MTDKTLDTLVSDIYKLMKDKNSAKGVDPKAEIEKFGEAMKGLMKKEFLPGERSYQGGDSLRMSAIGKPDLQQWYKARRYQGEKMQANTLIKFMYGHMIEEFVLLLVRLSGHEVTDEQKQVAVGGVTGHMDCKIDGVVVDVKSASPFGFKKFQKGTLAMDDPFGYVDQIKGYAHAEGDRHWAWLAMDKQNGDLAVLQADMDDKDDPAHEFYQGDIEERIAHVKKSVEQEDQPAPCSYPVSDGKSGNQKLSTICSYCGYKKHCYPNLRAFAYSTGPKFLTDVKKLPEVPEIDLDF